MSANIVTNTVLAVVIPESASVSAAVQQYSANYKQTHFEKIDQLLNADESFQPDLILCYLEELESGRIDRLGTITRRFPDAKLLLMGSDCPLATQVDALKHGARGYFHEDFIGEKLAYALNVVLNGEVWVARHAVAGLINELNELALPVVTEEQKHALSTLSPKELEVAKQVSHGATNKMIARSMDITERTVKAHLTTIFQKMHLPDRLSLAILFRDLRI